MIRLRFGIPQSEMNDRVLHGCSGVSISTNNEPLHGLTCKQPGTSLGEWRHNKLTQGLALGVNKIPGAKAEAEKEPLLGTSSQPNNNRADMRVQIGGETVMIDFMVTCPATKSKVLLNQTDVVPGRAAQLGYNMKKAKYAEVDRSTFKVLPFVIETGGRIHHKAQLLKVATLPHA